MREVRIIPSQCAGCGGPLYLPADAETQDFSWWPGRAVLTNAPEGVRMVHAPDCEMED